MANRLKKKTEPLPNPAELKPEKEEQLTIQEVAADDRTKKIVGAVSLLMCLFLFIAFTSYLFTWQDDQDKVQQLGTKIFSTTDVRVNNLLGVLGAYTAHNIMSYGFGLAAYLFCTFFFVLGVNLLFGKKVFSLLRNVKYMLFGLLVISVALSFFTAGSTFSWGGATGELVEQWFVKWIGNVGTGALLSLAVFCYFIWRFNPTFKLPARKKVAKQMPAEVHEAIPEQEPLEDATFFVEEPAPATNKLKQKGRNAATVTPKQDEQVNDPVNGMTLIEKEEKTSGDNTVLRHGAKEDGIITLKINEPALTINDLYNDPDLNPDDPQDEEEEDVTIDELPTFYEPTPRKNAVSLEVKKSVIDAPPLEIKEVLDNETAEESIAAAALTEAPVSKVNYDPALDLRDYKYPTLDLLETHGSEKIVHDAEELEANKNQIIETLKNYDIDIQRIAATVGPTVTLYEIVPAPGVRISRIKNLEDDIALSLAALGIRIIAPIPGKGTIGIEVPNVRKTVVSMKTLLASEKFQNNNYSLPIAIGKKIDNENFIVDLAAMPHLLMAGATGQGKSVGINTLLVSLLYKKHPSQLKFVLVDPKKVELSLYRVIEKHFLAKLPGEEESIITDTKKVIYTLNALCIEMDNRYDLLKEAGCRNIKEYNDKFVKRRLEPAERTPIFALYCVGGR